MTEQLAFDFSPPPLRSHKEFKARWYSTCNWCGTKDVPIFCHVGNDSVCSDCFTKEVEKRNDTQSHNHPNS